MAEAVLIGASQAEDVGQLPTVSTDEIRRQVAEIQSSLAPLMEERTSMSLREVSVQLAISATGKVGFIVAGSELTVAASITLTFAQP